MASVLVGYVIVKKASAGSGRMTLEEGSLLLYSFPQVSFFFFPENIRIFICEATKMSKAIISPSVLAVSTGL